LLLDLNLSAPVNSIKKKLRSIAINYFQLHTIISRM
jgi:hypothetical protein